MPSLQRSPSLSPSSPGRGAGEVHQWPGDKGRWRPHPVPRVSLREHDGASVHHATADDGLGGLPPARFSIPSNTTYGLIRRRRCTVYRPKEHLCDDLAPTLEWDFPVLADDAVLKEAGALVANPPTDAIPSVSLTLAERFGSLSLQGIAVSKSPMCADAAGIGRIASSRCAEDVQLLIAGPRGRTCHERGDEHTHEGMI